MGKTYYTDGACSGNGYKHSSGGYGIVEVDENDNIIWAYQDFKKPTTNNEMELMAILKALIHIQNNNEEDFFIPIIYSDSAYCVNIVNDWMYSWERNNWMRPNNQEIKNLEIIKQIYKLAHIADIRKIKGHAGHKWNEYADNLATGKIKLTQEEY